MEMMEETLLLVEDIETLDRVKEYLLSDEFEFVAVDTETTGVKKDSLCVGFSISAEQHIGIYVVLAHWEATTSYETCPACLGVPSIPIYVKTGALAKNQKLCKKCDGQLTVAVQGGTLVHNEPLKAASRELIQFLKDKKKLIMHNSPFDCDVINRTWKIELIKSVHTDTMELAHLLDENESCALKEVGARLFGEDAKLEKELMKASVIKNGGVWKENGEKEMYKADKELLGRYGAKDTILTLKIFYQLIPQLFEEGLDKFFYEEETMPLMRGPTYQMNTVGMKVDIPYLKQTGADLHNDCVRLKREVEELVAPLIDETWPFMTGKNIAKFSVTSNAHIAWLLFIKQKETFGSLTKGGKVVCKYLIDKLPYDNAGKRKFIAAAMASDNPKWKPWKLIQADAAILESFENKYLWVKKLLELRGAAKTLSTYVNGILGGQRYGIINPSFLQAGTVTGRYASRHPNFQNLPKGDKRIKRSVIARPGRVFVGADYSQLEPRVFASVSQDPDLMGCFAKGEDFYSVVGAPIFGKENTSMKKSDANSFAKLHEDLRDISKAFALATPYGTSAFQQAQKLGLPKQRCQEIIDSYLERYSSVYQMMLDSYEMVKRDGVVYNLYGRPRRLPGGPQIAAIYGDAAHGDLPYEQRSILNSAMNFRVQGSAGSIVNRAAIAFCNKAEELGLDAKLILQVHDELVAECREEDADIVVQILKYAMEKTTTLPGVELIAEPKVARNLSDLK